MILNFDIYAIVSESKFWIDMVDINVKNHVDTNYNNILKIYINIQF